jgi:hypothetical protein
MAGNIVARQKYIINKMNLVVNNFALRLNKKIK